VYVSTVQKYPRSNSNSYPDFVQGTVDAPTDPKSVDLCLAQMYWNKECFQGILDITSAEAFQAAQATGFTGPKLVEYEMIPPRLENTNDLLDFLGIGLVMCAGMRIYRDGLTMDDAFAAVVNSNGLKLEYFG